MCFFGPDAACNLQSVCETLGLLQVALPHYIYLVTNSHHLL